MTSFRFDEEYFSVVVLLSTAREFGLQFVCAVSGEQVRVIVLDINDNTPAFSQSLYVVDVSEGVAPGTEILSLTAVDRDEDQHLFYTIYSVTSPASNNKFKINSVSGMCLFCFSHGS